MENIKITAVVVTFNRKEMLATALEGILSQSCKVSHIVIVDNASTDGTREFIKERFGENSLFTYVGLQSNTGSAGGFNEGMKMAQELGSTWIWCLDDDVSPVSDCLEIMMKYKDISQCIHPSKKDINGKEFIWEGLFNPSTASITFLQNTSFKNGKDFAFVNIGCFEGMLIHTDIVSKIGLPDKRFFIAGDDMIYGFLASLHTNVIFVRDALLRKLIAFPPHVSLIGLYYGIRNQFLIKDHLKKQGLLNRPLFYLYFVPFVFYTILTQSILHKSLRPLGYVSRAVSDGFRGKFYKK